MSDGVPHPTSSRMHYFALSYRWTDKVNNRVVDHHGLMGCDSAAGVYEWAQATGFLITSVSEISRTAFIKYVERGILKAIG